MLSGRASQLPLSLRLAGGVACGAVALALNHIPAPLLSSESPEFAFGGALVLFAFWQLGLLSGLVAAFIGYAVDGGVREVMLATMVLYAIEGLVVSRLVARTRSLVVADVLYWLTVGAVLDVLVYRSWMEIPASYVLILLVKQLLNGVMNSVLADAASRLPWVRQWAGAPLSPARSWQDTSFDRTVPVVMVPVTIIVLLLARASYAAHFNGVAADLQQALTTAEEGAELFLLSSRTTVEELARQLSTVAGPDGRREMALRVFNQRHREFRNLVVTDAAGTVRYSWPASVAEGDLPRDPDIDRQSYLEAARVTRRPVFGTVAPGPPRALRPDAPGVVPLAVPLFTTSGSFDGVVLGALDLTALQAFLVSSAGGRDGSTQLLDRAGSVVASFGLPRRMGKSRAPELTSLLSGRQSRPMPLSPRDGESYADRLGIEPRLTVAQPVSGLPFTVMADEPLSTVHRAMIPTSLALIVLMLVALLAVYAAARALGSQLSAPLQSIGAAAKDLARGREVPREVLAEFEASPVVEIRTLAEQLGAVDAALRLRREADASAVQLSESRYNETLEQLVQAQKMEGIGRLAGGIAHDFNNLLMPILGYTDLAISSLPDASPGQKDLAMVRIAAERAREVVAQLLAFSRAQVLDLHRIDLAQVVAEFEPLLRRTLGEHIDLLVIAEPGIIVEADRPKVQQVLMNIVINAADAMPHGGRVEVRVGLDEVAIPDLSDPDSPAAGTFGAIVVRDTGSGMDDETRRKAFDPFFTTKPHGKGTGLGLSTAYGIARQHRGTILVDSIAGSGTRMRVLLPLAAPSPVAPAAGPSASPAARRSVPATGEAIATLLVVEDERAVRQFVCTALTRAGFAVLDAPDGNEALARIAAHEGRVDLLLTDVVMPGLNGRELARRFLAVRPAARVLFMSGYAADVIAAEGTLSADADLLVKPFTPDELVARVLAELER